MNRCGRRRSGQLVSDDDLSPGIPTNMAHRKTPNPASASGFLVSRADYRKTFPLPGVRYTSKCINAYEVLMHDAASHSAVSRMKFRIDSMLARRAIDSSWNKSSSGCGINIRSSCNFLTLRTRKFLL